MKKNNIIRIVALVLAVFTLTVAALETKDKLVANTEDVKSVAWYAANIAAAQAKNKQCHDDASIASSQECVNALYALELSFGLKNKPVQDNS
jgi:hypothetical protein